MVGSLRRIGQRHAVAVFGYALFLVSLNMGSSLVVETAAAPYLG
jgi:hypothetical protein